MFNNFKSLTLLQNINFDSVFFFSSKSVRSRRTQTSPTPSSPDQVEENTEKNDVIVVWPMAAVDSQNSIQI